MSDSKGRSVPQSKPGMTVAPSPLNPVKLDLAVILILGVVLWFAHEHFTDNYASQLFILAAYGVAAMLWIILKIKRILRELAKNAEH